MGKKERKLKIRQIECKEKKKTPEILSLRFCATVAIIQSGVSNWNMPKGMTLTPGERKQDKILVLQHSQSHWGDKVIFANQPRV